MIVIDAACVLRQLVSPVAGSYDQDIDSPGPWTAALYVRGDLRGTVQVAGPLDPGTIDVDGAVAGMLRVLEMYDSEIRVNVFTGNTTGTIQIGNTSTAWEADGNNDVFLDLIEIGGDLSSTGQVQFKGTLSNGTYDFICLDILGAQDGSITTTFPGGVTVNVENPCQ